MERTHGRRAVTRNEAKGTRQMVVWQDRQATAACFRKGRNNNLCAIVDDDRENVEEATDKKEDL